MQAGRIHKYPSNLVPAIHPAYTTYAAGTDSVPKRRHIQFSRLGITQKKEHKLHLPRPTPLMLCWAEKAQFVQIKGTVT
jgi:hypothetical protein